MSPSLNIARPVRTPPRWVDRRFIRKHSGLHQAVALAFPASAVLWVAVLHLLGAV